MSTNLFSSTKCFNLKSFIVGLSVGLFFAFPAFAEICFLPSGGCSTMGSTTATTCDPADYTGYTEYSTPQNADGWDCRPCGDSYICRKYDCTENYSAGVTCDDATEITSCSGYSGDDQCCLCENRAQKCIDEGYQYIKNSEKNVCVDACPYDSNYYKICSCPDYNLNTVQATDKCVAYDECIITYRSTNTSYFKENGSNRTGCSSNPNLVPETNDMVSDTEHYDCSPSCTEACENNNQGMRYYLCSRKPDCPGGYRSESECLEALAKMYGQANAFDWRGALYEVAQCLLPVKPAYAQQVNTQPSVTPEINGGNGYQQQTDTGETPELAGDDGYQQHMSHEAECRKKCASSGGTAYNACMAECMGLVLEDSNFDNWGEVVGHWEFDGNDDTNEPEPTTNEPTSTNQYECVQEGACWYHRVKQTCSYEYRKVTMSDTCGTNNLDSGCAYNTCCHQHLEQMSSVLVSGGSPKVTLYNRIKKGTDSCVNDSGVMMYKEICEGTPKALCTGANRFIANGCVSQQEYNGGFYTEAAEWGDCVKDCTKLGDGSYDTLSDCQTSNTGKTCYFTGICYITCEKSGRYTRKIDCGDDCVQDSNGCYYDNSATVDTNGRLIYNCTTNTGSSALSWWIYLTDGSGNMVNTTDGVMTATQSNIKNSIRVRPGTYKVCVVRDNGNGNHSISVTSLFINGRTFPAGDLAQNQSGGCTTEMFTISAGQGFHIGATITSFCSGQSWTSQHY